MSVQLGKIQYWSLPVWISCVGLSLPTHPSLDGVMVTLYSVPHSSVPRGQPAVVLLQLCRRPVASVADTVYTTPATPLFQVTDATPVVQLTVGRKVGRGQGAERKRRRGGEDDKRWKEMYLSQIRNGLIIFLMCGRHFEKHRNSTLHV